MEKQNIHKVGLHQHKRTFIISMECSYMATLMKIFYWIFLSHYSYKILGAKKDQNASACMLKFIWKKKKKKQQKSSSSFRLCMKIIMQTYKVQTHKHTHTYLKFTLGSIGYNRYLSRISLSHTLNITSEYVCCMCGCAWCVCVCVCKHTN